MEAADDTRLTAPSENIATLKEAYMYAKQVWELREAEAKLKTFNEYTSNIGLAIISAMDKIPDRQLDLKFNITEWCNQPHNRSGETAVDMALRLTVCIHRFTDKS